MRTLLTLLLTSILTSSCQSAVDAVSDDASPVVITGPAASAIAGDMASRFAEQIGSAGSTSLAMNADTSEFAAALKRALMGWGFQIVPEMNVGKDQRAVPLAWSIDRIDGKAFASLATPSLALSRTYVLTSQGAAPVSPLSIMQPLIKDGTMVQSLHLSGDVNDEQPAMRRINRLPIIVAIAIVVLFIGVVVFGLSLRGISFGRSDDLAKTSGAPATNFGDQLKRGISNGIIGEPAAVEAFQPVPPVLDRATKPNPPTEVRPAKVDDRPQAEPDAEWRARLKREADEQYLREAQRQRMARLQAQATALESPLKISIAGAEPSASEPKSSAQQANALGGSASDLYSAATQSGLLGPSADPNGQASKEAFFNKDVKDLGYLPSQVVPPMSPYELKRGSVIPATLISGLNSDLPGRLMAQVSQNVYDSATGHQLLIPQGAKLFGRYDSKVSFGQQRVLVVWTDLIFPNGSTLQIGGMAGTDAAGYGGFNDQVDRHLLGTFGSAALIAVIGAGIDMSVPQSSTLATQDTASDAARRNFAETFGQTAEQTISKNLNVQPTIQIRPGYIFNVLVDQDIIFPASR